MRYMRHKRYLHTNMHTSCLVQKCQLPRLWDYYSIFKKTKHHPPTKKNQQPTNKQTPPPPTKPVCINL